MGIDYERLIFRRQFLLTAKKIDGLDGWRRLASSGKTLYVHPDLEITVEELDDKRIILIGFILDWRRPELGNSEIIRLLLSRSKDFAEVLESTYELAGRFAIIYEDGRCCRMFHDAGGQREIYFHRGEYGISCAAQLPIIGKYLDAEVNPDEDIQKLYDSSGFVSFKKQWVGEETIYKDTKDLKPNHYLDLSSGETVRYWPTEPLERIPIEKVVERASAMLQGILKASAGRRELMLPVTAGWDSRLLLAASRDISDKVMYYIIKFPHMYENHMDIDIPGKLFKKLGIEYRVFEAPGDVDERFREIFCGNTAYCREGNLPGIYSVFFKMFQERLNITSQMSEVIRSYKGDTAKYSETFYNTCVAFGSRDDYYSNEYVKRTSKNWIDSNLSFANEMNIAPLVLFYWEEWLSWEASQRSETDIAMEEFTPFSCRNLMALLLSVDPSYRNTYSCRLYRKLMENMWPQVLSEPINPSFKRCVKGALVYSGMFYKVKKVFKKMNIE